MKEGVKSLKNKRGERESLDQKKLFLVLMISNLWERFYLDVFFIFKLVGKSRSRWKRKIYFNLILNFFFTNLGVFLAEKLVYWCSKTLFLGVFWLKIFLWIEKTIAWFSYHLFDSWNMKIQLTRRLHFFKQKMGPQHIIHLLT
jgi:hypothetical protein